MIVFIEGILFLALGLYILHLAWYAVYWVLGIFLKEMMPNSARGFLALIMLYFIATYPIWHEADRQIYWGVFAFYVFGIVLVGGHHLSKLDD